MAEGPYERGMEKLANCLCAEQKDKDYTVNEVAERCGLDPRTVMRYTQNEVYQAETNKILYDACKRQIQPKKVPSSDVHPGLFLDPPQGSGSSALLSAAGVIFGLRLITRVLASYVEGLAEGGKPPEESGPSQRVYDF